MEVGVAISLFPKTFVDDVDIVFILPLLFTEGYVSKQNLTLLQRHWMGHFGKKSYLYFYQ